MGKVNHVRFHGNNYFNELRTSWMNGWMYGYYINPKVKIRQTVCVVLLLTVLE